MANSTLLEDFPNEILCQIFDYLHALDLFWAFTSPNTRISSILKEIRLHVNISVMTSRGQLEFLSHHLIFHSDQVISLDVCDEVYDQTNVIEYLFGQHNFPNLRSCIFWSLDPSSKLENVLTQLKKQTPLLSFRILEPYNTQNEDQIRSHAHLFSKEILLDTPSTLRHVTFRIYYHYPELIDVTIINTNLTYLELIFYEKYSNLSIAVLVPILDIHSSLRQIHVTIKSSKMSQDSSIK